MPERAPLIVVEDVHFHYPGGVAALRGVSLTIGAGEFIALVGLNGSGKTTLAKHLNGLLHPSAGRVLVDGQDTRQQATGALARTVGYVFQNPDHQIFQPTVTAEVSYGPRNVGITGDALAARVETALARFGLSELRDHHPMLLGRGTRRRVALAAVYATQPRLLVLDEPTGGLDRRGTVELMATLEEFVSEGGSVLLITHDMRLAAAHATRVIVMRGGQVLRDGPTATVMPDPEGLAAAGVRPPAVTRLALALAEQGMSPALTVDEFCAQYLRLASDPVSVASRGRGERHPEAPDERGER